MAESFLQSWLPDHACKIYGAANTNNRNVRNKNINGDGVLDEVKH